MLVRAINSIEHGGYVKVKKNECYIVYAVEHERNGTRLYILPAQNGKEPIHDYDELDPLAFDKTSFLQIADLVSGDWLTKKTGPSDYITTVSSFPEWFENGFDIRAHDWNLENGDYKIINKYKLKYEKIYSKYLP